MHNWSTALHSTAAACAAAVHPVPVTGYHVTIALIINSSWRKLHERLQRELWVEWVVPAPPLLATVVPYPLLVSL